MKTDELITLLAANATLVQPHAAQRRFLLTLGSAALLLLAVTFQLLGPRADMAAAAALPMFWLKLVFPASIAAGALLSLRRLGHPGMGSGRAPLAIALILALMWAMSVADLLAAPSGQRASMLFGSSWRFCLGAIAVLSVPALWLAIWALRGLAPTRPVFAGAAAGLFAGACGAFAYAFYCTEMQLPFVGVWYAAGMLTPALAGALLGRRFLRW